MNNEKPITDKIKSISKPLSIILKIARIFCYVGIGISIAGIVYIMLFGNTALLVLKGNVVLHSPFVDPNISNINIAQLITVIVAGIIALMLTANLFRQAENIFKDISVDSSPFELKHVKRIKRIAVLYLIISLFDFQTSTASSSMISLNLVAIVGALMFWCMALIFEYGCALQKESDETI